MSNKAGVYSLNHNMLKDAIFVTSCWWFPKKKIYVQEEGML